MPGTTLISLEQYHERYSNEHGYEYWFGEVVRKPVPTWLHSILQALLAELFTKAGYIAGSELDLRIDRDWEPRPDVAATLKAITEPYPTKPIEVVAEVLSPDDTRPKIKEKCSLYDSIGIAQIFVFDPERKQAWQWDRKRSDLEQISDRLALQNGATITLEEVWSELERRVHSGRAGDFDQ
jgi:Uma2 family endonuclease